MLVRWCDDENIYHQDLGKGVSLLHDVDVPGGDALDYRKEKKKHPTRRGGGKNKVQIKLKKNFIYILI
jgi:hypothetical protein